MAGIKLFKVWYSIFQMKVFLLLDKVTTNYFKE